jgi:hypothetical protein
MAAVQVASNIALALASVARTNKSFVPSTSQGATAEPEDAMVASEQEGGNHSLDSSEPSGVFNPKLYTFKAPDMEKIQDFVKNRDEMLQFQLVCPEFHLLLDSTIAVIWHAFADNGKGMNKLTTIQIDWALKFLEGTKDNQSEYPKDISALISFFKHLLLTMYNHDAAMAANQRNVARYIRQSGAMGTTEAEKSAYELDSLNEMPVSFVLKDLLSNLNEAQINGILKEEDLYRTIIQRKPQFEDNGLGMISNVFSILARAQSSGMLVPEQSTEEVVEEVIISRPSTRPAGPSKTEICNVNTLKQWRAKHQGHIASIDRMITAMDQEKGNSSKSAVQNTADLHLHL